MAYQFMKFELLQYRHVDPRRGVDGHGLAGVLRRR